MANTRIVDLNALTTPSSGSNVLLIIDTSDFTLSPQGTDKQISITNLSAYLASLTQTLSNKTLVTPVLGVATATSINKVTITPPATDATLTIPDTTTMTGPSTSQTLIGRSSTDTLTNKTMTDSTNTIGPSSLISFNCPQGFMINGKITTAVSSNNLTVSLVGLNGSVPSATNPVYVNIGGTIYSITSSLSVTSNAGTNWFNSGAAENATQDIDYFVYLGHNATDGITLGIARIPYARVYGDFSATSTNDKYAAISTVTHAASTDPYELIGRCNLTLSASSSFNWSIPATSIIINRPIFTTRWLIWQPSYSASSAMTWGSVATNKAVYKVNDQELKFILDCAGTVAGTSSSQLIFSLPLSMNGMGTNVEPSVAAHVLNNGGYANSGYAFYESTTSMSFSLNGSNFTVGSVQGGGTIQAFYKI